MSHTKFKYRAWLKIKWFQNNEYHYLDRFGGKLFKTRREALCDAAALIREVKNDPDVEWRNEIETYGTVAER